MSAILFSSISFDVLTLASSGFWTTSVGSPLSLTYSFPWTTSKTATWEQAYSSSGEPYAAYHSGLSSVQIAQARSAFASWSNVANISFTEVNESSSTTGDIRVAFTSDMPAGDWGFTKTFSALLSQSSDIWISNTIGNSSFYVGSYDYNALIHEIGHTIELKHPGDYNGASGTNPQGGPFLPASLDNKLYSIMSYNEPYKANFWFDGATNEYKSPNDSTPMVFDIAAAQYLYGANIAYHTNNDVYTFNNIAPFRMAIWDAGGTDTISAANSTHSCYIDLTPGNYSVIQTARIYNTAYNGGKPTADGCYNLGIANGVIIENAIGSLVNDTIIGNSANNILDGGGGSNTIYGGGGYDIGVFHSNRSNFNVQKNALNTIVTNSNSSSTLYDISQLRFDDCITIFDTSGTAAEAYRLYKAAFNRVPDNSGLGYWIKTIDSGTSLVNVAYSFANSQEFKIRYGAATTDAEYVTLLYQNTLSRMPDESGKAYWVAALQAGSTDRAGVLTSFSESIENQNSVASLIGNGIDYMPFIG
ncbi:MAG: hypothetical protein RL154_103 [Pseudomonadota bacterium]|jgi:hypothetical protein